MEEWRNKFQYSIIPIFHIIKSKCKTVKTLPQPKKVDFLIINSLWLSVPASCNSVVIVMLLHRPACPAGRDTGWPSREY